MTKNDFGDYEAFFKYLKKEFRKIAHKELDDFKENYCIDGDGKKNPERMKYNCQFKDSEGE